jgi:preprotein translocase subunit SecF
LGFALLLVLLSLVMGYRGLNFGIDFEGGILLEVEIAEGKDVGDLRLQGKRGGQDFSVQPLGGDATGRYYLVKSEIDDEDRSGSMEALRERLQSVVKEVRRSELVGPTISAELKEQALWALVSALVGILLYIWVRFQWRFACVAVLALLHDVLVIIGFYGVTGFEVNVATVAVVLTVAGYSINDTVVVLDKIRENMRRFKTTPLIKIYDMSLNETLGRTLMTSVTTLAALVAIVVLGSGVVREFAWGLIGGVLVGTFSSLGLAVPFLSLMKVERGGEVRDEGQASR